MLVSPAPSCSFLLAEDRVQWCKGKVLCGFNMCFLWLLLYWSDHRGFKSLLKWVKVKQMIWLRVCKRVSRRRAPIHTDSTWMFSVSVVNLVLHNPTESEDPEVVIGQQRGSEQGAFMLNSSARQEMATWTVTLQLRETLILFMNMLLGVS